MVKFNISFICWKLVGFNLTILLDTLVLINIMDNIQHTLTFPLTSKQDAANSLLHALYDLRKTLKHREYEILAYAFGQLATKAEEIKKEKYFEEFKDQIEESRRLFEENKRLRAIAEREKAEADRLKKEANSPKGKAQKRLDNLNSLGFNVKLSDIMSMVQNYCSVHQQFKKECGCD